MLSRFHLIPERHGQTDGQTYRIAISISRVSVLTRDKKTVANVYNKLTSSRRMVPWYAAYHLRPRALLVAKKTKKYRCTFDTRVVGLQVGNEIFRTRCGLQEARLRNTHATSLLPRTPTIHLTDDVSATADIVVT